MREHLEVKVAKLGKKPAKNDSDYLLDWVVNKLFSNRAVAV